MTTPALPPKQPSEKITWRTVVLSLLFLPFIYVWHIECEALRYTFPTLMAPFYSVVFTLLILVIINAPLKRFCRQVRLYGWRIDLPLRLDVDDALVHVL